MSDQELQRLAGQLTRALAGPLRSLIEDCKGKGLLSEIREQPTGMNRLVTRRDLQTFLSRGFNQHQPNGDCDEPQFL